jgi:hypothetical protein
MAAYIPTGAAERSLPLTVVMPRLEALEYEAAPKFKENIRMIPIGEVVYFTTANVTGDEENGGKIYKGIVNEHGRIAYEDGSFQTMDEFFTSPFLNRIQGSLAKLYNGGLHYQSIDQCISVNNDLVILEEIHPEELVGKKRTRVQKSVDGNAFAAMRALAKVGDPRVGALSGTREGGRRKSKRRKSRRKSRRRKSRK